MAVEFGGAEGVKRLIKNAIQCLNCGEIISSAFRHDWQRCECGNCYVDGGLAYQRVGFTENSAGFVDLSEYEGEDNDG